MILEKINNFEIHTFFGIKLNHPILITIGLKWFSFGGFHNKNDLNAIIIL